MKHILKEYIKKAIREQIKNQQAQQLQREKSIYIVYKFPGLKEALTSLLSPSFSQFISDVKIIAPKPTTFKIMLTNKMEFNIYYPGRQTFIAKIRGKKYSLGNVGETERASTALARMLELNYAGHDDKKSANDIPGKKDDQLKSELEKVSGGGSSSFSFPPEEGEGGEEIPGEEGSGGKNGLPSVEDIANGAEDEK